MRQGKELLHVKSLSVSHIEKKGSTKIVDRVDLKIHEGETVGLIGPTGTGKTVTAKAIMRLLEPLLSEKPEWEIDGEVLYRGRDLMGLSEDELRELRGKELSIIFQKPTSSLNPLFMIGQQTGEPMGVISSRRIMAAYLKHLPNARELRRQIMMCDNLADLEALADDYLAGVLDDADSSVVIERRRSSSRLANMVETI